MKQKSRCAWATSDPLYMDYHDNEWGVPVYDDQKLFEFLILEGAQAGLSWITILKKRENYRACFDNFNPKKMARYDEIKVKALLENAGIIRNRLKIQAAITNAKLFHDVVKEFGSFSDYLWRFIGKKPLKNHWKNSNDVPAKTSISDAMSKDLKKRGFKFVGSTICYAFMQAVGMVDDHTVNCFCYKK
jgi:DNA-3-methyladenine glycosylase I